MLRSRHPELTWTAEQKPAHDTSSLSRSKTKTKVLCLYVVQIAGTRKMHELGVTTVSAGGDDAVKDDSALQIALQ